MDDASNMAGALRHHNGVSDFMAQVKQELGVLQKVLSASGVSTQYLQSVGQDVLSPAGKINSPNTQAEPKIAATDTSTQPVLTTLGRNVAYHAPSITDNPVEPAQPSQAALSAFQDRVENAYISPVAGNAGISTLPAQSSAVFVAPTMQGANSSKLAEAPGAVAASPATSYAPSLADPGQFMAPANIHQSEGAAASVTQFSNAQDAVMALPQSQPDMLPIDGPYAGGAEPRVRDYPVSQFALATGTTQAPIWPSQNNASAQPMAAQSQMAGDSTGPNNQSQPSKSPDGGDVYLDGLLVGKWMSRFLQQQVSRAQAGPTGFDSRRGRLLPGATVG